MLPVAISTVASTLQIIDYVVKFARWLSPPTRSALLGSRQRVQASGLQSISAQQVETTLCEELGKRLPVPQVEAAVSDPAAALEPAQAIVTALETNPKQGQLPDYADALGCGILQLVAKLSSRRFDNSPDPG